MNTDVWSNRYKFIFVMVLRSFIYNLSMVSTLGGPIEKIIAMDVYFKGCKMWPVPFILSSWESYTATGRLKVF